MKECIILAGGLGTRLQSIVNDVPKCMANVAGKPFIQHLFDHLQSENIDHVILSLGYKHEVVLRWLNGQQRPFEVSTAIEKEPLGTGGAIALAFRKVKSKQAIIINGDTFFEINLDNFINFHNLHKCDISVALKPMKNFDRYGTVMLSTDKRINKFMEKQYQTDGLINAGIYCIEKKIFSKLDLPERFSFEKYILENKLNELSIYGYESDGYFIDIGIPSDFEKANNDFLNK